MFAFVKPGDSGIKAMVVTLVDSSTLMADGNPQQWQIQTTMFKVVKPNQTSEILSIWGLIMAGATWLSLELVATQTTHRSDRALWHSRRWWRNVSCRV